MPKQDFAPIWPPGRHLVTLQELRAQAVDKFPDDARRLDLFFKFESWVTELRKRGVVATVWLDGSFVTEKPGPDDIDCVLWNPRLGPGAVMTPQLEVELKLLVDRTHVEAAYKLDFYLEKPDASKLFHREAYWAGVFGFCHDRTKPKGFLEMVL